MHASTLVQQSLSSIAQLGGAPAAQLWNNLVASGSFASISKADLMSLLKGMGEKELIVQDSSGLLLPGELGERLINHYEFYTAFTSDEEFRLLQDGKPLGSLPVSKPLTEGQRIIFGGRRWQVQDVDLEAKVIVVTPARGGEPPQFDGLSAQVHDRVRLEMRNVLMETSPCPFLDKQAQHLLQEARSTFQTLGLATQSITGSSSVSHLLTWQGDHTNDALALLLRHVGIQCENNGLSLEVAFGQEDCLSALRVVGQLDVSDPGPYLEAVENMIIEKWDWALPRPLLMKSYASSHLDLQRAVEVASEFANRG